ncbi:unnamed protein product [Protopolystoma xenopodis]|uniref:Uncharacterized protein n=1 Tax=Protopolystoma xenopodis TaxID=117903 RepID=A0A3S4ZU99_9PLAT|nr:unnamed protein product [Protopolystoma xenopodis]
MSDALMLSLLADLILDETSFKSRPVHRFSAPAQTPAPLSKARNRRLQPVTASAELPSLLAAKPAGPTGHGLGLGAAMPSKDHAIVGVSPSAIANAQFGVSVGASASASARFRVSASQPAGLEPWTRGFTGHKRQLARGNALQTGARSDWQRWQTQPPRPAGVCRDALTVRVPPAESNQQPGPSVGSCALADSSPNPGTRWPGLTGHSSLHLVTTFGGIQPRGNAQSSNKHCLFPFLDVHLARSNNVNPVLETIDYWIDRSAVLQVYPNTVCSIRISTA